MKIRPIIIFIFLFCIVGCSDKTALFNAEKTPPAPDNGEITEITEEIRITDEAETTEDGENQTEETTSNTTERPEESEQTDQDSEKFFPLGVYMPWGTLKNVISSEDKLSNFLDERMQDLKKHNVNLVWTSAGAKKPSNLKIFIKQAERYEIKTIGALNNITYSHPDELLEKRNWIEKLNLLTENTELSIKGLNQIYPYAFSLTEEIVPTETNLERLGAFIDNVFPIYKGKTEITMTTMPNRYKIMDIKNINYMPFITSDTYMFFDSTCGARTDDYSYRRFMLYTSEFILESLSKKITPWMFLQATQKVWGNWFLDENDNVVLLPGTVLCRKMPTPEQIRWQIWASVAMGAKGVMFFTYGVNGFNYDPTDNWEPNETISSCYYTSLEAGLDKKEETNTNSPISLVSWPNYKPSKQYEALGETYLEIDKIKELLLTLTPNKDLLKEYQQDDPRNPNLDFIIGRTHGDIAMTFGDSADKKYLIVVRSTLRRSNVQIKKHNPFIKIKKIEDIKTNKSTIYFQDENTATFSLEPGQGDIYLIQE